MNVVEATGIRAVAIAAVLLCAMSLTIPAEAAAAPQPEWMSGKQLAVCALVALIGLATLLMPCARYLTIGWRAKRTDIMDGLNADARVAYFAMFCRANAAVAAGKAEESFDQLYERWYGRRHFWGPGILLVIVGLVVVTALTLTSLHRLQFLQSNPFFDLPTTALAALAGAYLWVVNDLISRARRLDFSPADVQWGVLRFVIAIPLGYAFASLASGSPFIAFALGAFPLKALTSMLQRIVNKTLKIDTADQDAEDGIKRIQGINSAIVERLADEDVTTVTQIAYCDPVRLVMRSNLTFNFVTDCMNQALAWMYFEDQLVKLRPLGLRGACEMAYLIAQYDDVGSNDPARESAHARAVGAMPHIAATIGQNEATLQVTLRQIAEDPFTVFLGRVWT